MVRVYYLLFFQNMNVNVLLVKKTNCTCVRLPLNSDDIAVGAAPDATPSAAQHPQHRCPQAHPPSLPAARIPAEVLEEDVLTRELEFSSTREIEDLHLVQRLTVGDAIIEGTPNPGKLNHCPATLTAQHTERVPMLRRMVFPFRIRHPVLHKQLAVHPGVRRARQHGGPVRSLRAAPRHERIL